MLNGQRNSGNNKKIYLEIMATIIRQYVHRPNNTELGHGNTHETYMLVSKDIDLSEMFPPTIEVSVEDRKNSNTYALKAASGREFRINQMGDIYRDYNVFPGDEIYFTQMVNGASSKIYLSIKQYNKRVVLNVTDKGVEVFNIDRLKDYEESAQVYKVDFREKDGPNKVLNIEFLETKKKREDSPNTTDYYKVSVDGVPMTNGTYYLNLSEEPYLERIEKKYEYNVVLIDDEIETISKKKDYISDKRAYEQIIYYGCPGSGKSYKVKDVTDKIESEYVFRTTFHPDCDYASFVGCYKPSTRHRNLLDGEDLTEEQLLERFFDSKDESKYKGEIKARYLYESLVNTMNIRKLGFSANDIAEKLKDKKFDKTAYTTEASCMYKIYDWLNEDGAILESNILYLFIPQIFTNAYIKAWKNPDKPIYLIIEEINRGNCAQIFGDLFQLLDRDKETGRSEYPIKADKDLAKYIESQLGVEHEGIKEGKLCLPSNLIIYATMNTSDQSLFPMDSAFKRRWDWEYVPINYSDSVESDKFTITIEDGTTKKEYKWVDFLKLVNDKIYNATNSEDKQMGNFFIKKSVDTNEFVNKVMFYLWNEVCKEEYGTQRNFFRRGDKGETEFKFTELFDDEKGKILNEFMSSLGLKPMSTHTPETLEEA